jgi:hypothetical protein
LDADKRGSGTKLPEADKNYRTREVRGIDMLAKRDRETAANFETLNLPLPEAVAQ